MKEKSKWSFTAEEKNRLVDSMTAELATLRTKADVSQEELAELIGVTRQTYGSLERGTRRMTWTTFLSLLLFYDRNCRTHDMMRTIDAIPQEIERKFNAGNDPKDFDLSLFIGEGAESIIAKLDDQAKNAIRTMILVEYARCTQTPGDAVIKAFDGLEFNFKVTEEDVEAGKALKKIRRRKKKNG
ncbi:MAG: helix-turn-helix transcriptional regulator [Clostridia bacterium]|nr:helix-turn-helix transcriptional regulator [Clostridia bacterium]